MKSRKWIQILLACMLALTLCSCDRTKEQQPDAADFAQKDIYAMDTVMTVTAYGERAGEAVKAAEEEINRLDNLLSTGKKDSEISALNRGEKDSETSALNRGKKDSEISALNDAKKGALSKDCVNLIAKSLKIFYDTDGAFDITVYPLMEAWGFPAKKYQVPEKKTIENLLKNVDASKIHLNEKNASVTLPKNAEIDLGGIAKGYTSDKIMEIFRSYGVEAGMVSLGGNVQTYRTKPDGSLWKVGIENPDQGKDYLGILTIRDQAVVTSGGYERYFEKDGKRYHHIIDPKTGYPAETGLKSVTVVSEDGALADGLSTALFVMGKAKALDYWNRHSGEFDVILEETDGTITVTGGIAESFTSEYDFDVIETEGGIAENE